MKIVEVSAKRWRRPPIRFPSRLCRDDLHVAEALFSRAEEWLGSAGMSAVRGPIDPCNMYMDRLGYGILGRFLRFMDALIRRRPGLAIRKLDFFLIESEAEHIWRTSNSSLQGNCGYVPLDRGELVAMLRKLRTIIDRDAVLFVEDGGKPIGYFLRSPDLNAILRRIKWV